jgi:hypothetical protein
VRAAAQYVSDNSDELADELAMATAAQRSLLTIELHELFVDRAIGGPRLATPSLPAVRAEIRSGGAR